MRLAALFLVTCELCLAIRVPIVWDPSASEVKQQTNIRVDNDEQFSVDSFKPENVQQTNVDSREKPNPVEYFQYTAKKPQFAVDIANFHGMQSPENHYKSYSINPHTGKDEPKFGKHRLLDKGNVLHRHLQEFANINEDVAAHAVPVASNYEVFHPYEAETPAMQKIYKDPTLTKIRNDLENSKNRLQTYEKEAGEPHIHNNEYLETPHKIENRFLPHRNVPAPYEIHRPQKKPIYYRAVQKNPYREQYLNQKLKHPWNQYSAKIRPVHYRPIKNHVHHLRQNHALKYDDARNEYPQVQILESISSDPKDGYDIYEKGKKKFFNLRDNVDESINKAVKENRPTAFEKLEMQNNENEKEDEDDFVPIKNYAQVRKSETYKHLPKSAAFEDAENLDEIKNAPRLREAVKSTKAQTVYSEEGYEDTAYDHAGEHKHASENEGHGGYLKEHELSSGKYKTPTEIAKYEEGTGSVYRDQLVHAEKWNDDSEDNREEAHEEDYNKNEQEHSIKADEDGILNSTHDEEESSRRKREDGQNNNRESNSKKNTSAKNVTAHDIDKRYVKFEVPQLDFNSTFLTENEIHELAKIKIQPKKDDISLKYPYYFKNIQIINKHSPLRYSENLKHIPKKSKGGTEFYDSRSQFECPEVDELPDPIPNKLKGEGHPDENDNKDVGNQSKKGDENYNTGKQTPRLTGLGDKIDCFKAKYFGENPLDSPFFKEDVILDPEPVTLPNIAAFKLIKPNNKDKKLATNFNKPGLFDVSNYLRYKQNQFKSSLPHPSADLRFNKENINLSNNNLYFFTQPQKISNDILNKLKLNMNNDNIAIFEKDGGKSEDNKFNLTESPTNDNITNHYFLNTDDIIQLPSIHRQKRSSSFVYEPYKIIRDSQIQDSKKTTTTSNISPLIRQLQSSRIVDRAPKRIQELDKSENPVKRNVNYRNYKDIGRKDRAFNESVVDITAADTNSNVKRGEPRYEIRHANHKVRYTPVENKKSLTFGDYKAQTSFDKNINNREESTISGLSRQKVFTVRSPSNKVAQNIAASSNTIHKRVSTTTAKPQKTKIEEFNEKDESVEDYEEYEDEEEDIFMTTTTTTPKPSFRRRIRTTTEKIIEDTETPKSKQTTELRHYDLEKNNDMLETQHTSKLRSKPINKVKNFNFDNSAPKYREKKKKSTKSTLVTDTKKYGDDDHDMQKEEVDALIGVKHDMSDYMPSYEKNEEKLRKSQSNEEESDEEDDQETDESDEDDNSNIDGVDDEDYEENDENEDNIEGGGEEESSELKSQVTTPEPTKRTLAVTTDAPTPTIATQFIKPEEIPKVSKKKIEIHKELPANKSSAHVTQFKHDIKEIEVVKELPVAINQKPQKNLEVLELYRDDNLAKDINKLGGVEIFKKDIDLKNGPKHGGNYRSLEEPSAPTSLRQARRRNIKEDAETSQSEFKKHIELEDGVSRGIQMHGGNLRPLHDNHKIKSRGRSSNLRELSKLPITSMHGGNLKHRGRGHSDRSQKLIELDDYEQKEDDPSSDHESFSNSGNSRPLHGGNYRSEQLVATEKPDVSATSAKKEQNARKTSAAILNSFVQAAPILTTTPAFILDPSKRMYYYVDA